MGDGLREVPFPWWFRDLPLFVDCVHRACLEVFIACVEVFIAHVFVRENAPSEVATVAGAGGGPMEAFGEG